MAPGVEIPVDGQPHRDVERSSGCVAVVDDTVDLHRNAVVINAVGDSPLNVGWSAALAHLDGARERVRVQHGVGFGMLGSVEVDVVRPWWRRLVGERPAEVAEVLAWP